MTDLTTPNDEIDPAIDAVDQIPNDGETAAVARELARGITFTAWTSGRSPSVLAAGCIYVAQFVTGSKQVTQTELRAATGVSMPAIRDCYEEIPAVACHQLTPQDSDHYDDIQWLAAGFGYEEPEEIDSVTTSDGDDDSEDEPDRGLIDEIAEVIRRA